MDVLILRDNALADPSVTRVETELLKSGRLCQQVLFSKVLVEVNGEISFHANSQEVKPKVVINWLLNRDIRAFELLKAFEAAGVRVINRADAWWNAGSDFLTSLTLYRAKVVHPYAWHAPSGAGILENQDRFDFPLIHMPSGKIGNNTLVQLADKAALQARMQAFCRSQHDLDFQRARETEYLGLVRVIVVGGEAEVACLAGSPRSQAATVKQWWEQRRVGRMGLLALNEDFAEKAQKAAAAMGLDLCSVELYQYPDGWEVAGLCACPDLKTVEDCFGFNVAGRLAGWINMSISSPD